MARTTQWLAGGVLACALILGLLLRTGLAWRLATDVPNDRSLHTRPTPRVGGWGIVPVAAESAPTQGDLRYAAIAVSTKSSARPLSKPDQAMSQFSVT